MPILNISSPLKLLEKAIQSFWKGKIIQSFMIDLIVLLKHLQIKVWRYKIEDIPIDSRYSDVEELL